MDPIGFDLWPVRGNSVVDCSDPIVESSLEVTVVPKDRHMPDSEGAPVDVGVAKDRIVGHTDFDRSAAEQSVVGHTAADHFHCVAVVVDSSYQRRFDPRLCLEFLAKVKTRLICAMTTFNGFLLLFCLLLVLFLILVFVRHQIFEVISQAFKALEERHVADIQYSRMREQQG